MQYTILPLLVAASLAAIPCRAADTPPAEEKRKVAAEVTDKAPADSDDKKAPTRVIRYQDDKLTLRGQDVPVSDVLDEIKKQTNAEVRSANPPTGKVTAEFEDLPLTAALERVLGPHNFTLTYAEDGKLKAIDLKGGPEDPAPLMGTAAQETQPEYVPEHPKWNHVVKTFDNRKKVPVHGRLKELSGMEALNWDYLVQASWAIDDPVVRAEAMETGLKALEDDAELREATLSALNQMDNAELAEFVRDNCKHTSEDFLRLLAKTTKRPEWRAKAQAILRELRAQERTRPVDKAG